MAKKFSGVNGSVSDEATNADYESALIFDKFRVGKTGVFFPYDLKTKYIPYDYLERAFLRIQEVNGKLCCGRTTFAYYRIVLVHDGKEFIDYISENEQAMRDALAAMSAQAPELPIGFVKAEE